MGRSREEKKRTVPPVNISRCGFTLVELLVAISLTSILLAALFTVFASQRKTQVNQKVALDMQQSVRSAFNLMQHDIRMAGYDPGWRDANGDGVDDRRNADLIDNDCDGDSDDADPGRDEAGDLARLTAARANYVQFRLDRRRDGDFCDPEDLIGFGFSRSRDRNRDGIADAGAAPLGRSIGASGLQPLAEDIEAVAFAYAFDDDGGAAIPDGDIDTQGGHVIWAYDSDDDGRLDMVLDSDGDGMIGRNDDLDGNGRIDDAALVPEVPISQVRAVRIWLLGRTRAPLDADQENGPFVVGDKVMVLRDGYGRLLLSTIVFCRNLGYR